MVGFFGAGEPGRGRHFLDSGYRWGGAGGVFWDEPREDGTDARHCVVDVGGSLLETITPDQQRALLCTLLALGFRATRVDVALDVFGSRAANLIDLFHASCLSGELCGARTYGRDRRIGPSGLSGDMVMIGKRGKDGSGRYLRVYDKGLETKQAPAGEWVRVEAEFADDCARQAGEVLASYWEDDRGVEAWGERLVGLVLGCVDFRVVTGRRELKHRPVVEWWREFCEGVRRFKVKASRVASSLASWCRWIERCVAGQARTFADRLGVDLDEFLRIVAPRASACERYLATDVGREFMASGLDWLRRRASVGFRFRGEVFG